MYLRSISKTMADRAKKRGKQKYKNLNISRTKRALFRWNKKHFSKWLKGYRLMKKWKITDTSFKFLNIANSNIFRCSRNFLPNQSQKVPLHDLRKFGKFCVRPKQITPCLLMEHFQNRIQDPVKHLRWRFLQK